MSRLTGKNWLGAAAVGAALLSLPALSHFDDKQMPQS